MQAKWENWNSNFAKIMREICEEEGITLQSYSGSWVYSLKQGPKEKYIFGYQFGLNLASAVAVCNDKCTTYEILQAKGIPAVPHICFMSPADMKYVGANGCFREVTDLLDRYGKLVVKDNEGTGGKSVVRVSTRPELENALIHLFQSAKSVAVSPYIDIEEECRLIVLDGRVEIAFVKRRPSITGDGVHTVRELTAAAIADGRLHSTGEVNLAGNVGTQILPEGAVMSFTWKHNLGQGAEAVVVEPTAEMTELALAAAGAVGVRFASVDLVQSAGGWQVLEINGGVMCENLAGTDPTLYQKVKAIYRKAILEMMAE